MREKLVSPSEDFSEWYIQVCSGEHEPSFPCFQVNVAQDRESAPGSDGFLHYRKGCRKVILKANQPHGHSLLNFSAHYTLRNEVWQLDPIWDKGQKALTACGASAVNGSHGAPLRQGHYKEPLSVL